MVKRILYIEDNPNDQRLVQKVLTTHGYDIVIAEDGPRGLDLARQIRPDLILVDVQMPGLDGLATARCLREIPECAATPIVALTAHAERYSRQLYLDAGCTDYEQKQAGIKPILALVQRYLDK
ncbi:MAG TPA: response regulator [Aggregatilineaceae bacterium]|nr:response regulator [Aggregatilineaceae bacterium]